MKDFEKERAIRLAERIRDDVYYLIKLLEGEGGFNKDDIDSLYVTDFRMSNIIFSIEQMEAD